MIKKLVIENVGRFKLAKTNGDEQYFKQNTFIYGKNTFGKSTLTAILRSLKENNPDFIVGRKTIGSQKQSVKIIPETATPIGEYRYSTEDGKWNHEYKDIVIFDSHFVREGVYTQSQQIGPGEQKNIEAFMLGAKGVEYNLKISELDKKIEENTKTQRLISAEYTKVGYLLGGLTFDAFRGLAEIADVDKKIENVQKDIDKTKNFELISSKLKSIRELLVIYEDFDASKISEKLSVNSELITRHFDSHVSKKENKQAYGTFLQSGSKLRSRTEDECCPFCTQEIKTDSAKEFLKTIDLVYNENYKTLQQAAREAESMFSQENFSVEVEKIRTDLLHAGYVLEIDFTDLFRSLEDCEKSIMSKKDDLSSELNAGPLADISTKASSCIVGIDAELVNFQNPAERKSELENSLKELQANKERHGSWKERCESYLKAKKDTETLGPQRASLWSEYLAYANTLSTTMLTDINTVLSACSCDFTVQTFSFQGNQRKELLVLNMGGDQISNDGEDGEPTIKNCLSDSDKWVLALAFFLVTVKNDTTIKVVVMDDPVSSFDTDRKRVILTEIKRILKDEGKQLILLTHERGFYELLYVENKREGKSEVPAVFLKLAFETQKGSDFVVCNPDEDAEFMSDYNRWVSEMRNAAGSHDIIVVKNAHANIRLVVEHVLKAKYPIELERHNILTAMLTELEAVGGPYATVSHRRRIEGLLPNLDHHDNSGANQYPVHELGINDYKKNIKDAFEVIKTL